MGTDDGFEIARADLRLRGMGDLFGERQSGVPTFRVADPLRDEELNERARDAAERLLADDPELRAAASTPRCGRVLNARYRAVAGALSRRLNPASATAPPVACECARAPRSPREALPQPLNLARGFGAWPRPRFATLLGLGASGIRRPRAVACLLGDACQVLAQNGLDACQLLRFFDKAPNHDRFAEVVLSAARPDVAVEHEKGGIQRRALVRRIEVQHRATKERFVRRIATTEKSWPLGARADGEEARKKRKSHPTSATIRGCRTELRRLVTCSGRMIVNVVPTPGVLSHATLPWCASTICRTIASPSPEPA